MTHSAPRRPLPWTGRPATPGRTGTARRIADSALPVLLMAGLRLAPVSQALAVRRQRAAHALRRRLRAFAAAARLGRAMAPRATDSAAAGVVLTAAHPRCAAADETPRDRLMVLLAAVINGDRVDAALAREVRSSHQCCTAALRLGARAMRRQGARPDSQNCAGARGGGHQRAFCAPRGARLAARRSCGGACGRFCPGRPACRRRCRRRGRGAQRLFQARRRSRVWGCAHVSWDATRALLRLHLGRPACCVSHRLVYAQNSVPGRHAQRPLPARNRGASGQPDAGDGAS